MYNFVVMGFLAQMMVFKCARRILFAHKPTLSDTEGPNFISN